MLSRLHDDFALLNLPLNTGSLESARYVGAIVGSKTHLGQKVASVIVLNGLMCDLM